MSMLDNLANIEAHGIRAFLREEEERWACDSCGGTIDVHKARCHACGKIRP